MLEVAVGAEGIALGLPSLSIETDQISGDVLDALLCAVLDALPSPRTDDTQIDLRTLASRTVVGELVQAVEIDIDRVVVAVDELDELLHVIPLRHAHQPVEAPDPVVRMYDEVATAEAL